MNNSIKKLKFVDSLVKLILSGEKRTTWRLFDDKNLTVGDDLIFINKDTDDEFGTAKILSVIEKKLIELNDSDYEGHEKYGSFEKMYESYGKYYNENIGPNTLVKIIKFDFFKLSKGHSC